MSFGQQFYLSLDRYPNAAITSTLGLNATQLKNKLRKRTVPNEEVTFVSVEPISGSSIGSKHNCQAKLQRADGTLLTLHLSHAQQLGSLLDAFFSQV